MSLRLALILTAAWIVLGCGGSLGILYRIHSTTPGGLKPERASTFGTGAGTAIAIVAAIIWAPYIFGTMRAKQREREDRERETKGRKKRNRRPDRDE